MYCRYCGCSLSEDARYCPNCGKPVDGEHVSGSRACCVLAYIPILFWLPLVAKNKTEFGKQVANQGLLLLIANFVGNLILNILIGVFNILVFTRPISMIIGIVSFVYNVVIVVYVIMGMVNAYKYKLTKIPVIGNITLIG